MMKSMSIVTLTTLVVLCGFASLPASAAPSGDEFATPPNPNRRAWTITDVDAGSAHLEKGYVFRVTLDGSDIELKPKGKMKNDWNVNLVPMADVSTAQRAIVCGPVSLDDDGTQVPHEVWLRMDTTSTDAADIVVQVQSGDLCDDLDVPGGSGRILN